MRGSIFCASFLLILTAGIAAQQQKKPHPQPPQKNASQPTAPKVQPPKQAVSRPQPGLSAVGKQSAPGQSNPRSTNGLERVAPAPIRTEHPQSTISVSPAVPITGALPLNNSRPPNAGAPADLPKTIIRPYTLEEQKAAVLPRLAQALRVQRFETDPSYRLLVCGEPTCQTPSFTGPPPSPPAGRLTLEVLGPLGMKEKEIRVQAQAIVDKEGAPAAERMIDDIRRKYDPTYK